MNLLFGTELVVPIKLTPAAESDLHRAGGAPLHGAPPQCPTAKHLLTVGLNDTTCLCVFQAFEGNYDIEHCVELQGPGNGIEVVFHPLAPRRDDGKYHGAFSAVGIQLGAPQKDGFFDGEKLRAPDSGDKLGGEAFLFQGGAEKLVGQLKAEDFAQFLQLDFAMLARRELNVTGEPPFMGGIFHLFLKPLGTGEYDWRCYWEIL